MTISRQHETTTIDELRGAGCQQFLAVRGRDGLLGPLYLQVADVWHRFYLDAGLLFWAEDFAPNEDDDLLEGDEYLDLARALGVSGVALGGIAMHDCVLLIAFENSTRLVLRSNVGDGGARVLEPEARLDARAKLTAP